VGISAGELWWGSMSETNIKEVTRPKLTVTDSTCHLNIHLQHPQLYLPLRFLWLHLHTSSFNGRSQVPRSAPSQRQRRFLSRRWHEARRLRWNSRDCKTGLQLCMVLSSSILVVHLLNHFARSHFVNCEYPCLFGLLHSRLPLSLPLVSSRTSH
jgi:hypothetical protein